MCTRRAENLSETVNVEKQCYKFKRTYFKTRYYCLCLFLMLFSISAYSEITTTTPVKVLRMVNRKAEKLSWIDNERIQPGVSTRYEITAVSQSGEESNSSPVNLEILRIPQP